MTFASVPWLELAVAVPLVGGLCVARVRDPLAAARWCLGFAGAALGVRAGGVGGVRDRAGDRRNESADVLPRLFGRTVFALDALSAPLVPLVALLHFLTALATARTKMDAVLVRLAAGRAGGAAGDVRVRDRVGAGRAAGAGT